MKKIKFLSLFAAGLLMAACDKGDFDDWAQPQSNEQQPAVTVSGFTASSAGAVDLNTAGDSVKVINLSETQLPEGGTIDNIRMTIEPQGNLNEEVTLKALTADGKFRNAELQETLVTMFGPRPDARNFNAHVYANVMIGGQAAYVDCGQVGLTMTPKAPHIASKYYLVGGALDWAASAASKEQVFTHSGKDVYDDPVFTYIMESNGGEMWFAFGDDEALAAIGGGDWTKLFGTKGDSKDLSGSFDFRYNLGGDHSFCVDGAATSYRITINMMDMTYEITPISIAAQYYLVGALQGWDDKAKTCMMTPEGNNVLSFTTKWTGDHNLKIWDADNFGNWGAAFGSVTDGDESPSGMLTNSNSGAIKCPEGDAFYTLTIDMNAMTYKWTKLANQTPTEYSSISLIGEFSSWSSDFDLTQVAPHNWHGVFKQESDGQLKYRANHDWGVNWGFGKDGDWNVTEGFNRIGSNGAGNIFVPAGTYDVYLNDITGSMLIVAQ